MRNENNLFAKYQRRQQKFDDMVVLSLLLGFSTRKQQRFFQAFIGDSVSHQTASRLLQNLGEDLRAYQTSPVEDKYRFLIIDGLWVHLKELDIKKRPVLFALGITKDGRQEIIAFKLAKGETEEEYTAIKLDTGPKWHVRRAKSTRPLLDMKLSGALDYSSIAGSILNPKQSNASKMNFIIRLTSTIFQKKSEVLYQLRITWNASLRR